MSLFDKELPRGKGGHDVKSGIITPQKAYGPFATEEECQTYALGRLVLGVPEKSRTWEQARNGSWYLTVHHEGLPPGAKPEHVFRLTPSIREKPLTSHVMWAALKKEYGGRVDAQGKITFPPLIGEIPGSRKRGLSGKKSKKVSAGVTNPLYNLETYLEAGAEWSHTFPVASITPALMDSMFKVVERVPGGLPTPKGRNWKIFLGGIENKTNCWLVTVTYRLSDLGGWPPDIHSINGEEIEMFQGFGIGEIRGGEGLGVVGATGQSNLDSYYGG
ncbi:MAG: hypothetical protein AB7I98_03915 [Verrucomicrobiales bacterium]